MRHGQVTSAGKTRPQCGQLPDPRPLQTPGSRLDRGVGSLSPRHPSLPSCDHTALQESLLGEPRTP